MRLNTNFTINGTTNSITTDESSSEDALKALVWSQLGVTVTSFTLNLASLYCYKRGISGAKRLSRATFTIFCGGAVSIMATVFNFMNGANMATFVASTVGGAAIGSVVGFFGESSWRQECCTNNPRQIIPAPAP
ncbi:MAG: hypothetical protein JSR33_04010 [Proteobacteria bacterium]|nr:hypothetical protein [Pseudomonadota bacterium]